MNDKYSTIKGIQLLLFFLSVMATSTGIFADEQVHTVVTDDKDKYNRSIVSIDPAVTEILARLGLSNLLTAVNARITYPHELAEIKHVGTKINPDFSVITECSPGILFYSESQKLSVNQYKAAGIEKICMQSHSVEDSYKNIRTLGTMFNRSDKAESIIAENELVFTRLAKKLAQIPDCDKKRVLYLSGSQDIYISGKKSLQNDLIRLSGGIPVFNPALDSRHKLEMKEWQQLNPDIIIASFEDMAWMKKKIKQTGWKNVDAVMYKMMFAFPQELLTRGATKHAYFTSWLSALIYRSQFADPGQQISPDKVIKTHTLKLPLDYVQNAVINYVEMYDFTSKTLLVDFKEEMAVHSTLYGSLDKISTVGNHYHPPQTWLLSRGCGANGYADEASKVNNRSIEKTALLLTAADMDNLCIVKKVYRDMEVYALVTAGVRGNAMRMSRDIGAWYEPGTINIIIMTNMHLTQRAMSRAIITVTEGKTAALTDLDIRSSYTGLINGATGTGTDNITIVEGRGTKIDFTGGHTKMGELIASAVREAVQQAIYKQNGIIAGRNILLRMADRRIRTLDLVLEFLKTIAEPKVDASTLTNELERILLSGKYSGFIYAALNLSDDYEKGGVPDLRAFRSWCSVIRLEIAGSPIELSLAEPTKLPIVLHQVFDALLSGLYAKFANEVDHE